MSIVCWVYFDVQDQCFSTLAKIETKNVHVIKKEFQQVNK